MEWKCDWSNKMANACRAWVQKTEKKMMGVVDEFCTMAQENLVSSICV